MYVQTFTYLTGNSIKRKHFHYKYCIDLVMLLALKTLHNIQSNGVEESMPFFGGGGIYLIIIMDRFHNLT